jgi:hypothetical protein
LLAGAGHFVFMAPCDDEQHQRMPVLCKDADGVDRRHIHRRCAAKPRPSSARHWARPSLPSDQPRWARRQQQRQANPDKASRAATAKIEA